ncbi:MAG: DNA mismatch repair endonuclease MutL [Thermoguttaceae bacterium]|nr:DNA mismatch repair endonuclease MutL [Thermoguttaceae bacterium]MDW8077642.1 DNA mismatch repair endonuclease MutL [Thermoguttaceae bacterium]
MALIRRLPQEIVNKIAAGEVVERPASVVKELLENAIDAGAKRIDVYAGSGGAEFIRVVDDGCGIPANELELAVANHSTSKISSADDLFHIRTLGFRGEALAAIAAVSRLVLRSRTRDAVEGAELYVVGGLRQWLRPCGCPPGTTVEVRDLFFNTPVRRRFLRGTSTELAHLTEAFIRIALGHPSLHMTLTHNDRVLFDLPAASTAIERITSIFGNSLAEQLLPVESIEGNVRLWGFVGHPQESRTSTRYQYLFVNGRYVRDRSLQHALAEAYRGLLTVGRYPVAFLWLEMPPELVDVNVHPTKLEVRFHDGSRLYGQLLATLRSRFLAPDVTARLPQHTGVELPPPASDSPELTEDALRRRVVEWAQGKLASWLPPVPQQTAATTTSPRQLNAEVKQELAWGISNVPTERAGPAARPSEALPGSTVIASSTAKPYGPRSPSGDVPFEVVPATSDSTPRAEPPVSTRLGPLKAMQVMDSYLVTEDAEGILLIDQHALHEKILTLLLLDQLSTGKVASQGLTIPEPVDLAPEEAAVLLDSRQLLERLGLEIEPFGGGTVLVQAIPALLKPGQLGELLREIVRTLTDQGSPPERPALFEQLIASLACKAAVKAGDKLTNEEISALLAQRHLVQDAFYCPHGRPAVMVLSRKDLDRYFRRS